MDEKKCRQCFHSVILACVCVCVFFSTAPGLLTRFISCDCNEQLLKGRCSFNYVLQLFGTEQTVRISHSSRKKDLLSMSKATRENFHVQFGPTDMRPTLV